MGVPECAFACVQGSVLLSSCRDTDRACLCANATLSNLVRECIATTCGVGGNDDGSASSQHFSPEACGRPVESRGDAVLVPSLLFAAIALACVLLRLWARISPTRSLSSLGADDYIIVFCMVAIAFLSYLAVQLVHHGLGKHFWDIHQENITPLLMYIYSCEVIYLVVVSATRLSILFFLLRVFPTRPFRLHAYGFLAVNVAWIPIVLAITLFQCTPVSYTWTRWDGSGEGRCLDLRVQGWACAGINIALDMWLLIMPVPPLLALQMGCRKRVKVMSIFGLGIFVTITSMVRLYTLVSFATTTDISWDYVPLVYWSFIEAEVGVICASLPALNRLLQRAFPRLFDSSIDGDSDIITTATSGRGTDPHGWAHRTRLGSLPDDEASGIFRKTEVVQTSEVVSAAGLVAEVPVVLGAGGPKG